MKQTSARLGLLIILVFAVSSLAFADVTQQEAGVSGVTNDKINLRSGPGTHWRLLGTVESGVRVRLDGRDPRGEWVRGITPEGQLGWMAAHYLDVPSETVAALPIVSADSPSRLTGSAPAAGAAPSGNAAPAAASGPGIATETTAQVNVRSGPGTDTAKVGRLNYQAKVIANGRNADQDWVRLALPGGGMGWVMISYLALTAEQVVSLPIVEGGAVLPPAPAASDEAAPPASAVSIAPVRGFNLGGHVASLSSGTVNALNRAGMTWIKRQVRWQGDDGASVAGMVSDAHNMGYRLLIGVVGNPGSVNEPGYFDRYARFVANAAAAGVDAIEVWNEQNIDREWAGGSINPARYTDLLKQAFQAIKAANPNTLVISGALAPTGYFGGCSGGGCDDNAYLAGMAAAGAANYMDCVGAHYNEGIVPPNQTSGDPRGNSGHYSRYFWGMVNTYYNAFGGARALCFTELGYLSPEGFGGLPDQFAWAGNTSAAEHARWLADAVSLARGSGKVRMVIVWNVDFTNYGSDPMAGYAMIRPDGSCPACDALGR